MISILFINKDYEIILDVDLKYLENLYYCNLLPKSYNSMQTIVLMIGGVFWILTYIFIISKGFRDKTFGMPFFALCANISWEFVFAFVTPHSPPQLYINYLWFGLDMIIVSQLLKYGKNEFPNISLKTLYSGFILSVISASGLIVSGRFILGDVDGVFAAFGQNLLMSVLFIIMFYKRGKALRGQSKFIALFKMLGTGLTSLHYSIYEPVSQNFIILPILFISILFFDLLYLLLLLRNSDESILIGVRRPI
ncbi:MAG: hypothetical protein AB7V56_11830 [Candidatus Nitrosocosmicus sp.]